MPNIFLFQIVLPLVSPLIDLLFLLTLALWGLAQLRITQLAAALDLAGRGAIADLFRAVHADRPLYVRGGLRAGEE